LLLDINRHMHICTKLTLAKEQVMSTSTYFYPSTLETRRNMATNIIVGHTLILHVLNPMISN